MIYLIDASACIYAGTLAKRSAHWNTRGFPTGGLFKLFTYVLGDMKRVNTAGTGTVVVCFDNKNNIRRDKFPIYKENRKGRHSDVQSELIHAQMNIAYKYIKRMGIPVMMEDGYEADDLIYSVVAGNQDERILVRCDDNDLNDVVQFNPKAEVQSIVGNLNKREKGTTIWSIVAGNKSDNIPKLNEATRSRLMNLYKKGFDPFKQGTLEQMEKYMTALGVEEKSIKDAARNMFLVQPKLLKQYFDAPQIRFDEKQASIVLNTLGFKRFLKTHLREERNFEDPDVQRETIELLSSTSIESKEYLDELEMRYKEREAKQMFTADNKTFAKRDKKIANTNNRYVESLTQKERREKELGEIYTGLKHEEQFKKPIEDVMDKIRNKMTEI